MSSLFRRKTADVATASPAEPEGVPDDVKARPKGYTPSKGVATPKRASTARKVNDAAPANRREAYKQMRDRQREDRAEQAAGMRAGEERYLLPRDKGPERRLVRDLVDSRRTVGSWFIGGALIVMIGSTVRINAVQLGANILWVALALAVLVDSVFIARRIKRVVRERFPKSEVRAGSLQFYGVMRGLTFRRMRVPKPQVALGTKI